MILTFLYWTLRPLALTVARRVVTRSILSINVYLRVRLDAKEQRTALLYLSDPLQMAVSSGTMGPPRCDHSV